MRCHCPISLAAAFCLIPLMLAGCASSGSAANPTHAPAASPTLESPPRASARPPATSSPGQLNVGASTKPAEPSPLIQAMRARENAPPSADNQVDKNPQADQTKRTTQSPPSPPTEDRDGPTVAPVESQPQRQPPPPPAAEQPVGPAYPVAGMVGQVNGQAVYAADVFKPIHDQLATLGRQLPRSRFEQKARQIIDSRIRAQIIDSLILGQAQRDLTEAQRQGLSRMVQLHREKLLRQYGRGSESLAQQNLEQQKGQSLDKALSDFRQQVVVTRYLREKLYPKINVTRRDIERYYDAHRDQFQPRATRDVRLIRVDSADAAAKIAQGLQAGEPFEKLAHEDSNTFKPASGGLVKHLVGATFGQKPLNDAIRRLEPGQHAGPIHTDGRDWFVYLQSLDRPKGRSLLDAQRDIDRRLRTRQFNALSERYRARLLKEGSYNAPDQMVEALVKIAVSRFAAGGSQDQRDSDSGGTSGSGA